MIYFIGNFNNIDCKDIVDIIKEKILKWLCYVCVHMHVNLIFWYDIFSKFLPLFIKIVFSVINILDNMLTMTQRIK